LRVNVLVRRSNDGMSDEPTARDWARIGRISLAAFVLYVLSVGPAYQLARAIRVPQLLIAYGPIDWIPGLQWYLTLWGVNL
jgi:hypothetical protein